MPEVLFPAGQTLADGYGKRVHRKPNPNQKKLHKSHMFFSLTNNIPAQANKKHMQQTKPHVHAEQILYGSAAACIAFLPITLYMSLVD